MEQLTFLNMPDVVLQVAHTTGKLTIQGMDSMELLISANKGEAPKPLAKIASGGELFSNYAGIKMCHCRQRSDSDLDF